MDELSGHLTEVGGAEGDEERNELEGNDVELVRPWDASAGRGGYIWVGRIG